MSRKLFKNNSGEDFFPEKSSIVLNAIKIFLSLWKFGMKNLEIGKKRSGLILTIRESSFVFLVFMNWKN